MDEDSDPEKDLNNSLVDLHYGLDSSIDEAPQSTPLRSLDKDYNRPTTKIRRPSIDEAPLPMTLRSQDMDYDALKPRSSSIEDTACQLNGQHEGSLGAASSQDNQTTKDNGDDQMAMIHEMVLEMKQSFHSALLQLAELQSKESTSQPEDRNEIERQQKRIDEQQKTIAELVESMGNVMSELVSLRSSVSQLQQEQQLLQQQNTIMHKQHQEDLSMKSNVQNNRLHSNRQRQGIRAGYRKSLSQDNRGGNTQSPDMLENNIKASACKSLSLTQSLGQKLSTLCLNESTSDEERGDLDDSLSLTLEGGDRMEEPRDRLSFGGVPGFLSPQGGTSSPLDDVVNRRLSLPANFNKGLKQKCISQPDVLSAVQRRRAVKELADSERDYSSSLWCLLNMYVPNLQGAACLTKDDLTVLVPPYLDKIYAEHSQIGLDLQDRLLHWTNESSVADLIMRVADPNAKISLLSYYNAYAENFPSAIMCLKNCVSQSSELQQQLKTIKQSSCLEEDFFGLLLAPVQHIPKYMLKIQQILRWTPSSHCDFSLLESSLQRLHVSVDQLNSDILHAMQLWTKDGDLLRSTGEDGPSHLNNTEEESLTSARDMYKPLHSHQHQEWFDLDSTESHDTRSSSDGPASRYSLPDSITPTSDRANARSQPNLTKLSYSSFTTDLHQSALSHSVSHTSRNNKNGPDRQGKSLSQERHYPKYKVTARHHMDPLMESDPSSVYSDQRRWRPSSAVDFTYHNGNGHSTDGSNSNNLPDEYRGSRGYPRPQSAMASTLPSKSAQHRPMIISRKHNNPRTAMSSPRDRASPSACGASGAAQALNKEMKSISANELLPTYPSHQFYRVSVSRDFDDDGSDDTCASNATTSFVPSINYPQGNTTNKTVIRIPKDNQDNIKDSGNSSKASGDSSESSSLDNEINKANQHDQISDSKREIGSTQVEKLNPAEITSSDTKDRIRQMNTNSNQIKLNNNSNTQSVINKVIENANISWEENGHIDITVKSSYSHKPTDRNTTPTGTSKSIKSYHQKSPISDQQIIQLDNSPRHQCRTPVSDRSIDGLSSSGSSNKMEEPKPMYFNNNKFKQHLVENNRQFLLSLTSKSEARNGRVSPGRTNSFQTDRMSTLKHKTSDEVKPTPQSLHSALNGRVPPHSLSPTASQQPSSNSIITKSEDQNIDNVKTIKWSDSPNDNVDKFDNKNIPSKNIEHHSPFSNSLSPNPTTSCVVNDLSPSKASTDNRQRRSITQATSSARSTDTHNLHFQSPRTTEHSLLSSDQQKPMSTYTFMEGSSHVSPVVSPTNPNTLIQRDTPDNWLQTDLSKDASDITHKNKTLEVKSLQQSTDSIPGSSSDDHVAGRKKTHFKASIKNLFKKKKSTESDV